MDGADGVGELVGVVVLDEVVRGAGADVAAVAFVDMIGSAAD